MSLTAFLSDLLSEHGVNSAQVQIVEDRAIVRSVSNNESISKSSRHGLSNRWSSSNLLTRQQSDSCLTAPRRRTSHDKLKIHNSISSMSFLGQSDSCLTVPRRRTSHDKLKLHNSISKMSFLGQRSSPKRDENTCGNANEAWDLSPTTSLQAQDKESLDSLLLFFDKEFLERRQLIKPGDHITPKLPQHSTSLSKRNDVPQQEDLNPKTLDSLRIRRKTLAPYAGSSGRARSAGILRNALGSLVPVPQARSAAA